jgi:hypothetical protein
VLRLIIIIYVVLLSSSVAAQTRWFINFTPGVSITPPVPLSVRQENYETIRIRARYNSAPLRIPPYYSVRLGLEKLNRGWEVELNHLKIYLKNIPEEIDRFSVSHGYNQLFINNINKSGRLMTKAGFGLVIAHPENTVRGYKLNEKGGLFNNGYFLAGPVIQYGIFEEIEVGKGLYLLLEMRVSAAYARVQVVNGKADVPVVALHLQAGPGAGFARKMKQ